MVSRDGQGTDLGALEGDTQMPGQVASTQPQPQRQKDLGAFNFISYCMQSIPAPAVPLS